MTKSMAEERWTHPPFTEFLTNEEFHARFPGTTQDAVCLGGWERAFKVKMPSFPGTVISAKCYPHAFTEKEVMKYHLGWRPSKLLVAWWRFRLVLKEWTIWRRL